MQSSIFCALSITLTLTQPPPSLSPLTIVNRSVSELTCGVCVVQLREGSFEAVCLRRNRYTTLVNDMDDPSSRNENSLVGHDNSGWPRVGRQESSCTGEDIDWCMHTYMRTRTHTHTHAHTHTHTCTHTHTHTHSTTHSPRCPKQSWASC